MNVYNRDILLYTTDKCNLDCKYCYNEINETKKNIIDTLDFDKTIQFIDFLCENNIIDRIMLTWWEPLLYKNIYKLIEKYIWKKKISLFTNWLLLNKNNVKALIGVDIKISLHGLLKWSAQMNKYITMWKLLDTQNIKYWFIYMINSKNYLHVLDAYKQLKLHCNNKNFSFKFQPLVLNPWDPLEETYWLNNMAENDWDALWRIIDELITISKTDNIISDWEEIYPIWYKNKEFFEMIKDMYINKKHIEYCPTAPILTIAADGNIHPCMFLFNRTLWNINDLSDLKSIEGLLHNLSEDEIENIKKAKCFSPECIWACRPS